MNDEGKKRALSGNSRQANCLLQHCLLLLLFYPLFEFLSRKYEKGTK